MTLTSAVLQGCHQRGCAGCPVTEWTGEAARVGAFASDLAMRLTIPLAGLSNVTTHLPNGLAPKMDGAPAGDRCPTTDMILSQCVGGRRGCNAAFGVSLSEAASGADLGGSSKYSNENFEG